MEQHQRLVRDFSQLHIPRPPTNAPLHIPRPPPTSADWPRPSYVGDRPRTSAEWPRTYSDRLRPLAMEGLVQDFNTALDETAGSHSSERSTGRRKAWKRRCKSTSNLLQIGLNASEDSSSSLDNFGLLSRDRGTSSLQLSDSDLEGGPRLGRRNRPGGRAQEHRKRGMLDSFGIESDSFTENISPFKEFRVNSKRKRKSKRMAVDQSSENIKPLVQSSFVFRSPGQGTKRKKVRSRSGCEASLMKKVGITPGKRKRSAREKSADFHSGEKTRDKEDKMETDERRSSSSLSSSEWEDVGSDLSVGDNDGREADDEQSDWPGPEPGVSVMQLTDEEVDPDVSFSSPTNRLVTLTRGRSFSSREIKAGTRRLKVQKPSSIEGHKKLTHAEIVSAFLQDPVMSSVRVPLLRPTDRNLVLNLASLYSLSWKQEAETSIILSKNMLVSPTSEFAVPGIPRTKERKKFEPKRQKKANPISPEEADPRIEIFKSADVGMNTRQRTKSTSKSS